MSQLPTSQFRTHLAVSIDAEPDASLIQSVASSLGMSAYDVKLRLRPGLPKSLNCYESVENAVAAADSLAPLGVITIVYNEADLPPATPISVLSIELGAAGLRFNSQSLAVAIARQGIECIVLGCCRELSIKSETQPMAVLTPHSPIITGLPNARAPITSVSRHQTSDHGFLIIFQSDPLAPAIQIRQDDFHYECLGGKPARTTGENFDHLVEVLRTELPMAAFNDWLLERQSDNRGQAFYNRRVVPDSSAANATLIYWRLLATRTSRRHFNAAAGQLDDPT